MNQDLLASIINFYIAEWPVFAVFSIVVLLPYVLLERWRPVGTPPGLRDYGFNIAISVSTMALAAPFGILAAHAADAIREVAFWPTIDFTFSDITVGVAWLDTGLRIMAMILLPLFIHDLWFYWSHRLEHRFPALWNFHQLHHSDRKMNASTVSRDHVGQSIWRAFFSMFTLGLIFDLQLRQAEQAAVLSSLSLILLSQFYHGALRIELPWLDRVLVTPQVHRIHHSVDPAHRDKNFADVFPLMDIIFGTYHKPQKGEFPDTGLGEGAPEQGAWWQEQWRPIVKLITGKVQIS